MIGVEFERERMQLTINDKQTLVILRVSLICCFATGILLLFSRMFPNTNPSPPPQQRSLLHRIKIALGLNRTKGQRYVLHGSFLAKGQAKHPMEDFAVAETKRIMNHELGLFGIYDGHLGDKVAQYLQANLFNNILTQPGFWTDPRAAIKEAYLHTDAAILEKSEDLGFGGSTAVTAIVIDGRTLYMANVGDSRAVMCKAGKAIQVTKDHEPISEQRSIERKGGFVITLPGDVPRVNGQLAVARAFGDKNLKAHLSVDPDVYCGRIEEADEFLILASDGLWKVMENQAAVALIRKTRNPKSACKQLIDHAILKKSKDDISCIVVRFQ